MTTSITTPEGVINNTLQRIKRPERIGSIWEGSRAAKAALDAYGQCRDEILRTNDWPFARRDVQLVLINQAPASGYVPPTTWNPATNPPLPWLYQYAYPTDSLRIRSIRPVAPLLVNYDPREHRFSVTNDDQASPSVKTILVNVPSPAIATYTGRVTDVTAWDSDFTEAMIDSLARKLAPVLSDMEAAKMAAEYEIKATSEADQTQAG